MKAQMKSLFWRLVFTIGGLTLLLTIIQGICNFVFVTRYAANKDIVQSDLIKKQIEKLTLEIKNFPKIDELQLKLLEKSVDKLEREIIKLNSKSDEILKRLSITEKGNIIQGMQRDTIKDLVPALKITQGTAHYNDLNHIIYNYSIENIGKYSVKVGTPIFVLATSMMKIDLSIDILKQLNKISNKLIIYKDYRLDTDIEIGDISAGEILSYKIPIYLLNPQLIPNEIFYSIIFIVKTDPIIVESVKNIKKGEIRDQKTYVFWGSIIKPNYQ